MQTEITLETSDGIKLCGNYQKPETQQPIAAVILLHKFSSSKEEYSNLCSKLAIAGFATLAIDLRGHGQTAKLNGKTFNEFSEHDFRDMVKDADAAYQKLKKDFAAKPVFIIGSSIGANTALNYSCTQPKISAAVLLSPGRLYKGISTMEAASTYGKRPLMLCASKEDQYSYLSTQDLAKQAQACGAKVTLVLLDGAGHGAHMLGFEGLQEKVIRFLADVA
jgi:alpha-beta hydrolase superfamily lysophospholipase